MYFMTIIMNFTQVCPNIHLKVFGVPDEDLRQYKASGSTQYAYSNEPDDQYRLREMEVETEQEFKEHSTPSITSSTPSDFDFSNKSTVNKNDSINNSFPGGIEPQEF